MHALRSIVALSLLLAWPGALSAEDEVFPRLEIGVDIEIQNDGNFASDDSANELNDLYTTTEPAVGLFILPGLSIQSGLVFEPVVDPDPGDDRFFEQHGLYVEQLYMLFEQPAFALFGGKFNPGFGISWDAAPGIYGTEVAEDSYEQTERVGFGGALIFGGEGIGGEGFGEHSLAAQTFFADTSVLSESLGKNRGRTRLSSGGPANSEDLSSFSVTLDGLFPDLPGAPGYHLGFIRNEGGRGDPEDEYGFAAALFGEIDLDEEIALAPLVEVVHLENAGATGDDQQVVTGGATLTYGPWNLALSHSSLFGDGDDVDRSQVSVGYSFDFGLNVDLGYKRDETGGVETHTVGLLLHYAFELDLPN